MDRIHHQFVRMNHNGTIAEPLRHPWLRQRRSTTGRATSTSTRRPATSGRPTRRTTGCRSCVPTAPGRHARLGRHRALAVQLATRASRSASPTAQRGSPTPRTTGWWCGTSRHEDRRSVSTAPGNPGNLAGQLNRPMGIAVDEATGHVFVADTINNRIVELCADPGGTNIQLVRTIAYGFDQPEAIEIGPDGRIYRRRHRRQRDRDARRRPATWLATFGAAEGLDHPAGIATMPSGESSSPTRSTTGSSSTATTRLAAAGPTRGPERQRSTTPTQDQVFTTSPIMFTGTATDDLSVTNVRVAIRRRRDQQWWNGTAWQATPVQLRGDAHGAGHDATGWSYAWTPPAGRHLRRAGQRRGCRAATSTLQTVRPVLVRARALDTAAPNGTLVTADGRVRPVEPLTFTGNATDDDRSARSGSRSATPTRSGGTAPLGRRRSRRTGDVERPWRDVHRVVVDLDAPVRRVLRDPGDRGRRRRQGGCDQALAQLHDPVMARPAGAPRTGPERGAGAVEPEGERGYRWLMPARAPLSFANRSKVRSSLGGGMLPASPTSRDTPSPSHRSPTHAGGRA